MTIVPRTGPRSTSSALKTSSLYQAEKSSLWGVTPCCDAPRFDAPRSSRAMAARLAAGRPAADWFSRSDLSLSAARKSDVVAGVIGGNASLSDIARAPAPCRLQEHLIS